MCTQVTVLGVGDLIFGAHGAVPSGRMVQTIYPCEAAWSQPAVFSTLDSSQVLSFFVGLAQVA